VTLNNNNASDYKVKVKNRFLECQKTKLGKETEALATLQLLLVSESGSEQTCLQSPTKHRQTLRSENISRQFIPNVRYSHAESAADVCSLSPWHLEQRSLWGT